MPDRTCVFTVALSATFDASTSSKADGRWCSFTVAVVNVPGRPPKAAATDNTSRIGNAPPPRLIHSTGQSAGASSTSACASRSRKHGTRSLRSVASRTILSARSHMKLLVLSAVVVVASVMPAAQSGEGLTSAAFEVTSIKRNVSGATNWSLNPRPTGQFTVTNAPMASLVQAAFLVQDHQLEG